jgi:hypothetical protein
MHVIQPIDQIPLSPFDKGGIRGIFRASNMKATREELYVESRA